jgi:dihydroorotate dehydrogenase electron transfer subunit
MNRPARPPDPHTAPRRQYVTAPLVQSTRIGEDYRIMSFDVADAIAARPGQFLMIRGANWGAAPLLARPMSYLAGGPEPSILIRVVGEGTTRMACARPGDTFHLLGPLGNGWQPPLPHRRPLLVAGGVGVAPLLFLARALSEQGVRAVVAYGGRTDQDLPLCDELGHIADLHLSTEDGSRGTRGLVTELVEPLLGPDTQVCTCGPEPMMAKVAGLCAAHDVPCEASLETAMACGFGVCLGCAVPTGDADYLYACVDGPCVDARRVDWSRTGRTAPASAARRSPSS